MENRKMTEEELIRSSKDFDTITEIKMNTFYSRLLKSEINYGDVKGEGQEKINKGIISTDQLLKRLNEKYITKTEGTQPKLLPRNCRFKTKIDNKYDLYIVEYEPEIRTILVDAEQSPFIEKLKASGDWETFGYKNWIEENPERPYKFTLAFPYCIFLLILDKMGSGIVYATLRNMPLVGFGDMLYKPPLYNIQDNQQICMGFVTPDNGNIALAADSAITSFWNSEYNDDYIDNIRAYQDTPLVGDYFTWQYHTQRNPMFIYDVEWIPYKTVGEFIKKIYKNFESRKKYDESYIRSVSDICKLFRSESLVSKKENDAEKTFVYGSASYMFIDHKPIYIEDSFKIRGKRYFITSFVSETDGSDYPYGITHIEVIDENQKTRLFKLTDLFRTKILNAIEEEQGLLETIVNGEKIKKGDIVKIVTFGGLTKFRKVNYIRYNIDGELEARLGPDYHILRNLRLIETIDIKSPIIRGQKLHIGSEHLYLLHARLQRSNIIKEYQRIKFKGIDVNLSGILVYKYEGTGEFDDGEIYTIRYEGSENKYENLEKKILLNSEVRQAPEIFRVGTKVFSRGMSFPETIYCNEKDGFILPRSMELNLTTPPFLELVDYVLSKDKRTFLLESFDYDMCFSIGEKVITPNWENPLDMLKVKEIVGFQVDNENNVLNVVLQTRDGTVSSQWLLHFRKQPLRDITNVNINGIYHIENQYKNLSSGMKIKAKKARISNFPMKDTNIIIGFLSDVGLYEPLVLCSNGCTLWPEDINEKFEIIPYSSPTWKKTQHANLDLKKIRPQPGDIYIANEETPYSLNPYVISFDPDYGNSLKISFLNSFNQSSPELYPFDKDIKSRSKPSGILMPRYTQSQLTGLQKERGYISPNGTLILNEDFDCEFPVDYRRTLHYVQRLPE